MISPSLRLITCCLLSICYSPVSNSIQAEDILELTNRVARSRVALAGGGLIEFRLKGHTVNPLNWDIGDLEEKTPGKPYLRGHFLCLDRWGAPSDNEAARGVPFHGEAPRTLWKLDQPPTSSNDGLQARMSCTLKLAGLSVVRTLTLLSDSSVVLVDERITNLRPLGRIYNMVQHPSIAPPFLDETTLVDSNATFGFHQDGTIPASRQDASRWPQMKLGDKPVDLRHFTSAAKDVTGHDVSSFVFDDKAVYGWVTACHPGQRLMLGYVWRTADYPWLNIWRYRQEGRVTARGLEFGTTGLHQPFNILVRRGRILDRRLLSFIDAGASQARSYIVFLTAIPENYLGVGQVKVSANRLTLTERGSKPRRQSLSIRLPWPR